MHELAAWILFPLIALAICAGIGLLAVRVARADAHPAVVPALGFAVAIAVLGPLFATGVGGSAGCVVLVVLAVAGWAAAARRSAPAAARRSAPAAAHAETAASPSAAAMRPGFGAAAGVAAYALHIAPVALTGTATFLGYNLLNDTAIHLALVDWIGQHGSHFIHQPPSSYGAAINDYVGSRYPLGSHDLLAALKPVVGLDPALLYQPFLALCAGLAAAAIYGVLRGYAGSVPYRGTSPAWSTARGPMGASGSARIPRAIAPPTAAAIAFAALASQLVFSFALQGSIKELAFIVCLAAAAGVIRTPVLVALSAAALYSIYGIYAMPWIAPIAVLALFARPTLRAALVGIGVFVVAVAVYVPDSIHYYNHGHTVLSSGTELGPLAGPLKPIQVGGIWLNGDYRFTPSHSWITYALDIAVIALAVVGLVGRFRRTTALLLVPPLVAYAFSAPQSSPYIDAKLLAILSPAVVVAACLGIASTSRRTLAIGAGVVLGIALLVSDALAYRIALPAPVARLDELAHIDKLYAGEGPILVNEFEEYVKHYMRRSKGSDPYESWTAARAQLRDASLPVAAHTYDLDQMTTSYIERWPYIVLRRSPVASRPPSNYIRVATTPHYQVWKRTGPAPLAHVTLGTPPLDPTAPLSCKLVSRLSRSGAVVAAIRPRPILIPIAKARPLPPGWYVDGQDPLMLDVHKGGRLPITASGRPGYELWIRGLTTRADSIAGRPVPRSLQRPTEWIDIGPSSRAPIVIDRPTRSLRPGDAQPDIIGPIVAVPTRAPVLVRGAALRRACGAPADWIDVVRR